LVYKIVYNTSIDKDIKRIDIKQQRRILGAIQAGLSESPRQNGTPLKGKYKGFWKIYVIPYRIIYSIDDRLETVYIEKVGHRKDVYR
jgi:mRNA interferase RelE/StbE